MTLCRHGVAAMTLLLVTHLCVHVVLCLPRNCLFANMQALCKHTPIHVYGVKVSACGPDCCAAAPGARWQELLHRHMHIIACCRRTPHMLSHHTHVCIRDSAGGLQVSGWVIAGHLLVMQSGCEAEHVRGIATRSPVLHVACQCCMCLFASGRDMHSGRDGGNGDRAGATHNRLSCTPMCCRHTAQRVHGTAGDVGGRAGGAGLIGCARRHSFLLHGCQYTQHIYVLMCLLPSSGVIS